MFIFVIYRRCDQAKKMRNKLIISILVTTWLCSCGQKNNFKKENTAIKSEIKTTKESSKQLSQNPDLEKYIFTDTTYTTSPGKGIKIQNSFPKGGMIEPDGKQYSDSSGKRLGFAAFWTRIINETNTPLELNFNIPADSFAIFTPPDSYLRLLLPTQTVAFDKLSKFNYGLTDIESYLDVNLGKESFLQKTINPNQEYIFYVVTLTYPGEGTPRAELILEKENLYYKMSRAPYGSGIVPVGKITYRNTSAN